MLLYKKNILVPIAKLYLLVMFFTPTFFGYLNLSPGQLLYLAIYFFVSFVLILISGVYKRRIRLNVTLAIQSFLLLAIHYAFSTIVNFQNNNTNTRDVFEILRPIIYFMSFLLSIIILYPYVQDVGFSECFNNIENIIFYFSFFEFLKFIEPLKYFFRLYTPFDFGHINYIRFSGTTGFAYAYAWLLLICIIFQTVKKNGKISFRVFYYSLLITMTGSRTGFLGLCLLFLCLFVLYKYIRIRLALMLLLISVVIAFLYMIKIEQVVTSVDYITRLIRIFLLNEGDDGSLVARKAQIDNSIMRFLSSPLFGTGSSKLTNVRIENFYFHHLGTWGILGITFYVFLLFSFLFYIKSRLCKRIFCLILFISLFLSFSSPIIDQVRIFNIFYAIIAVLIIGIQRKHTNNCDE
jgi:hypothetical protein